jgi:carbamate kinase
MTIVMALGGNAIIRAGERGTAQQQRANATTLGASTLALVTDAEHIASGLAGQHRSRLVSGSPVRAGPR